MKRKIDCTELNSITTTPTDVSSESGNVSSAFSVVRQKYMVGDGIHGQE
jgi:hypothetical protein